MNIAPISKEQYSHIFNIRSVISTRLGVILPVGTMVVTTERTAIASISSTMAVPKINLASFVCIFPKSVKTLTDIAILVAVRAVATRMDCNPPIPNSVNT